MDETKAINDLNGLNFRLWKYTSTHDRLVVALKWTGAGDKLNFFFSNRIHIENVNKIKNASIVVKDKTIIFKAENIEIESQGIHRMTEDDKSVWCMSVKDGVFKCEKLDL